MNSQQEPTIVAEPPISEDVIQLLRTHLAFARDASPPGHVHALDLDGLRAPDITFCTARRDDDLLAVGALRLLGDRRAEIKSMHTTAAARGQGMGRSMLNHLLELARSDSCDWVGLETGTMEAFAPARALYVAFGFTECEPFGSYTRNEFSVCMSLRLTSS